MVTPSMPVDGARPVDRPADPAHLVIRNARIFTGDDSQPTASAVAISDGVFLAVGDDTTVGRHIGAGTQVVDGLGRRAIPGLNDSHTHVIREGNNYLLELRWDGVPTLEEALQILRVQAARTPDGQWVRVVGGFAADQFSEKRLPTLKELNEAAPDTPVFVLHLYQSALLNRAAVRAVGLGKHSSDPNGGQIVRSRDGEPTGLLLAAPAATLLYSTLAKGPTLAEGDKLESTRHFFRELNRFGLTSAIDAAGGFQDFPDDYATVMELATRGELTIRLAYHLLPQTPGQELDDLKRWIGTVKPGDGDGWLRANGAGEYLAWSAADYENFTEPRPQLHDTLQADLRAAASLLIENGWGFRIHATYDETIRRDLEVFEQLASRGGRTGGLGVPWIFDHAETVSESSIERIKSLGGHVAVQNRTYFQGRQFHERYGDEAAAWAPPVTKLLGAGLVVGAGTDATRVSSYNPWLSLYWLATGKDVAGRQLRNADNVVDRATALEMYTSAGAELSGEAQQKGTISVGKYADLVLLSADFFSVPDEAIPHIEADLTIVGGRIVYASDAYEGLAETLPDISLDWSPIAHHGGYRRAPQGVQQAERLAPAAADSQDQSAWRRQRGEQVGHQNRSSC